MKEKNNKRKDNIREQIQTKFSIYSESLEERIQDSWKQKIDNTEYWMGKLVEEYKELLA